MPACGRVWGTAAVSGAVLLGGCVAAPYRSAPADPAPGGPAVVASVQRAEPQGADLDALVQGMTRFGVDLYREVLPERGGGPSNVVVSPASLAIAFGMARAGARGETAEQIDAVLRFPADPSTTHAAMNALDHALAEAAPAEPAEDSLPTLAIANGVLPDADVALQEDYLALLAAHYGAGVLRVDYSDPARAKEILDAWVLEHTRGRIEELFREVSPDTALVLANAVYLRAGWARPFPEQGTQDLPFTLADGSRVRVPTMRQVDVLGAAQGNGWQAVELPYAGDRLAMRVIVPTDGGTPADVLDPAVLAAVDDGLTDRVVDLRLPRWDFDTDVALIPVLRALGMQAPFDPHTADFSGMTTRKLYIGDAIHRATITVDEGGTEAAAVTGLGIAEVAAPEPGAVVHADRAFGFVILDTATGAPLFLGQVGDPRG